MVGVFPLQHSNLSVHLLIFPLELVLAMSQNNQDPPEVTDEPSARSVNHVADVEEHGRDHCEPGQSEHVPELNSHRQPEHVNPRPSVASFETLQAQQNHQARTLATHNPCAVPIASQHVPYGLFSRNLLSYPLS